MRESIDVILNFIERPKVIVILFAAWVAPYVVLWFTFTELNSSMIKALDRLEASINNMTDRIQCGKPIIISGNNQIKSLQEGGQ